MLPECFVSVDLGQVNDPTAIAVIERRAVPTGRHEVVQNLGAWFDWGRDQPRYVRREQIAGDYEIVHLERVPLGTSYVDVVPRLRAIEERARRRWVELAWQESSAAAYPHDAPVELVVDQTGVGRPVVDLLREHGLDPVGVTIHGGDQVVRVEAREWRVPKRNLVGVVQVAMQARRLRAAAQLPDWPVLKGELEGFKARISLTGHDSYGAGEDWRSSKHDDLLLATALGVWYPEHLAAGG